VFESDLGADAYDLAIAGNFCHLFDANKNRRFLRRLWPALQPGASSQSLTASSESDSIAQCRSALRARLAAAHRFDAFIPSLHSLVGSKRWATLGQTFELSDSSDLSLITADALSGCLYVAVMMVGFSLLSHEKQSYRGI